MKDTMAWLKAHVSHCGLCERHLPSPHEKGHDVHRKNLPSRYLTLGKAKWRKRVHFITIRTFLSHGGTQLFVQSVFTFTPLSNQDKSSGENVDHPTFFERTKHDRAAHSHDVRYARILWRLHERCRSLRVEQQEVLQQQQ